MTEVAVILTVCERSTVATESDPVVEVEALRRRLLRLAGIDAVRAGTGAGSEQEWKQQGKKAAHGQSSIE